MKIIVTDRLTIDLCLTRSDFSELHDGEFALISIHSNRYEGMPGPVFQSSLEEKKFKKGGGTSFIQLSFLDLHEDAKGMDSFRFNAAQAREIIEFLDKIRSKVKSLIIHCDAGISRSGAVGAWATMYLKQDEESFRDRHPDIAPNMHVLKTLMAESGLKRQYKEFWEASWEE